MKADNDEIGDLNSREHGERLEDCKIDQRNETERLHEGEAQSLLSPPPPLPFPTPTSPGLEPPPGKDHMAKRGSGPWKTQEKNHVAAK